MNTLLKIQVYFLLVFFSLSSFAQTEKDQLSQELYENLSFGEKKDYNFVIQTCHMDSESFINLLESTKEDSLEYFNYILQDPSKISLTDNISVRRGLGKNTYRLLNSSGYYLGLRTCFPNNEDKRHRYTINLLLFDAYGKIATISIIVATGASLYKGLAFLGKRITIPPTVALFKKLHASEKFVSQIPIYMKKAGAYSFNGILLATIGKYFYDLKKDQEILGKSFSDEESKEFKENYERNLKLYYRTLELQSKAKTPEEKATVEALLAEQEKILTYYAEHQDTQQP